MARRLVLVCFIALILLGLAWELWLAPLRPAPAAIAAWAPALLSGLPASWLLSLKVLPLAVSLPGLLANRIRLFQGWSMGILLYLTEGLVRATSDPGPRRWLAWLEVVLAAIAYAAILAHVRQARLMSTKQPQAAHTGN